MVTDTLLRSMVHVAVSTYIGNPSHTKRSKALLLRLERLVTIDLSEQLVRLGGWAKLVSSTLVGDKASRKRYKLTASKAIRSLVDNKLYHPVICLNRPLCDVLTTKQLQEVVTHEMAHLFRDLLYQDTKHWHDDLWRQTAKALGGKGTAGLWITPTKNQLKKLPKRVAKAWR